MTEYKLVVVGGKNECLLFVKKLLKKLSMVFRAYIYTCIYIYIYI